MTDGGAFLIEDFIHSIATQLDRVQDALRLKAVNRPLTYALRDFSLDLHVFAEVGPEGDVRFRTAATNEQGASTVRLGFTTITRPMIEENTMSLQATQGPTLDELGLDRDEQQRLERLGVRTAGQLRTLQKSVGTGTVGRFARVPMDRLRAALRRGQPEVDRVVVKPSAPVKPTVGPAPPVGAAPPFVRTPLPAPKEPIPTSPAPSPPFRDAPLPLTSRPAATRRVRLEGKNFLAGSTPKLRFNDQPVHVASADDDALEVDLPLVAGTLALLHDDGEQELCALGDATDADPWGTA